MGARLSNFLSQILEMFPQPTGVWVGGGIRQRAGSPVPGSRYRVRSQTTADAVILPLGSTTRRVRVSLPPTAAVRIHAATRSDHEHVYGVPETLDVTDLMPAEERELARARGYLLEISRRDLQAHYLRG